MKNTPQSEEGFRMYCYYQLMKFCPWDDAPPSNWDAKDPSILQTYHDFLCGTSIEKMPVKVTELDLVKKALRKQQTNQVDSSSDEDEHEFESKQTWEAGKLLPYQIVGRRAADLEFDEHEIPSAFFTFDKERNTNVDWSQGYIQHGGESFFAAVDKWIETTKHKHGKSVKAERKRLRGTVDMSGLNLAQAHAVSCIVSKYDRGEGGAVLLYGTAGTGKSHVIKALAQIFGDEISLSAFTACAAQVIGGGTLHSNFPLPVKHLNRAPLTGSRLATWQKKLKGKRVLVADEVSMVSADLNGWWDYILRVITGTDEPYGGLIIVWAGDHGQLPPVMALPLYSDPKFGKNTATVKSFSGFVEYRKIHEVYILEKIERIEKGEGAQQLKNLVNAIRDGNVEDSNNDPVYKTIQSRFPCNMSEKERERFTCDDVVHLWFCKKPVAEYNLKKLNELSTPVARIKAVHPEGDKVSAAGSADDAGGLTAELVLCVGARVMFLHNMWLDAHLYNGSLGTVVCIIYAPGKSPPALPICVIVQLDNYIGPSFLPDTPRCVPVCPLTRQWQHCRTVGSSSEADMLSRTQIPLKLAYAMTIYKSQGQSIDRLMVHPGDREYQSGALFVALSRATNLKGLCIEECSLERILKTATGKQLKFRMLEEARLKDLARRHMAKSYDDLVVFCNKFDIQITEKWEADVALYRNNPKMLDVMYLKEKTEVLYRFQKAKDKKKISKTRKDKETGVYSVLNAFFTDMFSPNQVPPFLLTNCHHTYKQVMQNTNLHPRK